MLVEFCAADINIIYYEFIHSWIYNGARFESRGWGDARPGVSLFDKKEKKVYSPFQFLAPSSLMPADTTM